MSIRGAPMIDFRAVARKLSELHTKCLTATSSCKKATSSILAVLQAIETRKPTRKDIRESNLLNILQDLKKKGPSVEVKEKAKDLYKSWEKLAGVQLSADLKEKVFDQRSPTHAPVSQDDHVTSPGPSSDSSPSFSVRVSEAQKSLVSSHVRQVSHSSKLAASNSSGMAVNMKRMHSHSAEQQRKTQDIHALHRHGRTDGTEALPSETDSEQTKVKQWLERQKSKRRESCQSDRSSEAHSFVRQTSKEKRRESSETELARQKSREKHRKNSESERVKRKHSHEDDHASSSAKRTRKDSERHRKSGHDDIVKISQDKNRSSPAQDASEEEGAETDDVTQKEAVPELKDPARLKCRDLLKGALFSEDHNPDFIHHLAALIEDSIFSDCGDTGLKYKNRIKSRLLNLKDQKNPALRNMVLQGALTPQQIATMTPEEMASEDMKKLREKHAKEALNMSQLGTRSHGASSDMYKCNRCEQRNTTYYQIQILPGDEPMTTYVTCNECGNRWKHL